MSRDTAALIFILFTMALLCLTSYGQETGIAFHLLIGDRGFVIEIRKWQFWPMVLGADWLLLRLIIFRGTE